MNFSISFIAIALIFFSNFAKILTYGQRLNSFNRTLTSGTNRRRILKDDPVLLDSIGRDRAPGLQYSPSILLVRHSQSQEIPNCEVGHIELWTGYSLFNVHGNSFPHNQDLGSSGSCVRRFSTLPLLSCGASVCSSSARNGRTLWLSTFEPAPLIPAKNNEMSKYISRCVVCEAPANVIVLHSQSLSVPECPSGWEGLWIGYSFLMHTAGRNGGGGQDLSSTGSCLEDFRVIPFIECNSEYCDFYPTMTSFWFSTVDENQQFEHPEEQTFTTSNVMQRVSRCQVCIKDSLRIN